MTELAPPAGKHPDPMSYRFAFGRNWQAFVRLLDEKRIQEAERSLREMLMKSDLASLRVLDIGSGSGLFSLAARRLGASVHSVDLDPDSVACTRELKNRFFPNDGDWTIDQGSVLDGEYLRLLGTFHIVYSWGVLHHTGAMWRAIENAMRLVRPGGTLFIAIYNDQGWKSAVWLAVKKAYNALPPPLRFLVLWPAFLRLWGPTLVRDLMTGRGLRTWNEYAMNRGMSPWVNVVDWVGGYPFEVATPRQIEDFARRHGFMLVNDRHCHRGHGCNEFVFSHSPAS